MFVNLPKNKVAKDVKKSKAKFFWGECEIYQCNAQKRQGLCGKCKDFPCEKLKEWAASENPERIDNLKTLL